MNSDTNPLQEAIGGLPPNVRYALFGAGRFTERWLPLVTPEELNASNRTYVGLIDDAPSKPLYAVHLHATLADAISTWDLDCIILSTDTHVAQFRRLVETAVATAAPTKTPALFAPAAGRMSVFLAPMRPVFAVVDGGRDVLNTGGESLGLTVERYNRPRRGFAVSTFHTLCHAPFVSLDFGPQGQVNVCNHYHRGIADITDRSMREIFFGPEFSTLRREMLDYRIDERNCRHCARQIRTGAPANSFAQEQYDNWPADGPEPACPTVLTFRLSNTCNLACIMCGGKISSRIRHEREKLPPLPCVYDERFFQEIEAILPSAQYVEFFGGEPFLVREHLRVMRLIEKTGAQCAVYVNTNATTLTDEVRHFLETLNFVVVAVSMDAVSAELHPRIRRGIDHERFLRNLEWLLELRRRKAVSIVLNVTETRHNWFELPALFAFAAQHDCYLHINTCLHPVDCTLYDLPTDEIAYVTDFLEEARAALAPDLEVRNLAVSYQHLLGMLHDELAARAAGRVRPPGSYEMVVAATDGLLAVPLFFLPPFDEPAKVACELSRIAKFGLADYGRRFRTALCAALDANTDAKWDELRRGVADPATVPGRG
jgi:sulfatase maturation enzyme AslB (radical SAM superfamily)